MNGEKQGFIVVFITTSSVDEGKKIGKSLVGEKLAACVNVVQQVQSLFQWEGRVCDEREALLIIKTKSALFNKIVERVKQLHSNDVPEIIALPIVNGSEDYLNWISKETLQ